MISENTAFFQASEKGRLLCGSTWREKGGVAQVMLKHDRLKSILPSSAGYVSSFFTRWAMAGLSPEPVVDHQPSTAIFYFTHTFMHHLAHDKVDEDMKCMEEVVQERTRGRHC